MQGRGEDPACHKQPQKTAQSITWFKGQSNPGTPEPSSSWLASSCGIAPSLLLSSDPRKTSVSSTSLCPLHCYVHGFGFWNLELFSYWTLENSLFLSLVPGHQLPSDHLILESCHWIFFSDHFLLKVLSLSAT